MLPGITCGVTSKPRFVIPRAKCVDQLIPPEELSHTYRPEMKNQRDDCCHPIPVAYDPTPPDLQVESWH
jgi:hypothetical protein